MLLRCLLPLALLPLAAVASAACTLTDPTLTLQSYRVDAQKERIAMYWQDRHGKAWGSLRSLLAGIDGDGRVQMAMNGGIYDKAYAPLKGGIVPLKFELFVKNRKSGPHIADRLTVSENCV